MSNQERIQNLDYIRQDDNSGSLAHITGNGEDVDEFDASLTDNSSLTPSFADPLRDGSDDDLLSMGESSAGNDSGPFLDALLKKNTPGKKVSYREHKAMMRALNDRWEGELERTVRQSEELLYEQQAVVEHDQGVLVDRHMKEALDKAKEKEKSALKMEAKLREEYRDLKLQLDKEIENRKSREEESIDVVIQDNGSSIGAAKSTIQRYCLSELKSCLETNSNVAGDVSKDDEAAGNDTFRQEIRARVKKFQASLKEKSQRAIHQKEQLLKKEGAAQVKEFWSRSKQELEEIKKAHAKKVQQLHEEAERDRVSLITEMKQSFEESMSRVLQKKAGCLRF